MPLCILLLAVNNGAECREKGEMRDYDRPGIAKVDLVQDRDCQVLSKSEGELALSGTSGTSSQLKNQAKSERSKWCLVVDDGSVSGSGKEKGCLCLSESMKGPDRRER